MMDNATLRVRDAVLTDLDTIVAFSQAMAIETENKMLDTATVTAGVRSGLLDPAKARYFVAEVGGRIAGQTMITTEWSDWRNGYFWWIQSVYVDPAHRRSGVFRALHQHIRALAVKQTDVCGIRLYVYNENTRAIETYRRLGMTVTDYHLCEEGW